MGKHSKPNNLCFYKGQQADQIEHRTAWLRFLTVKSYCLRYQWDNNLSKSANKHYGLVLYFDASIWSYWNFFFFCFYFLFLFLGGEEMLMGKSPQQIFTILHYDKKKKKKKGRRRRRRKEKNSQRSGTYFFWQFLNFRLVMVNWIHFISPKPKKTSLEDRMHAQVGV
jgi:hypothetical protein